MSCPNPSRCEDHVLEDQPHVRRACVAVVWLLLSGGGHPADAGDGGCSPVGAIYRPNPEDPDRRHFYRLRIEASPLADDPAQLTELWRFQMFDRRTRRMVSELRLTEGCPNGRALCSLTTSVSRGDGPHGGDAYSEVIFLNRVFVQPTDFTAAYAMVMPGFATHRWSFGMRDVKSGYLTSDRSMTFPNLGGDPVWIRISCGSG